MALRRTLAALRQFWEDRQSRLSIRSRSATNIRSSSLGRNKNKQTCKVPGCKRKRKAMGRCQAHLRRFSGDAATKLRELSVSGSRSQTSTSIASLTSMKQSFENAAQATVNLANMLSQQKGKGTNPDGIGVQFDLSSSITDVITHPQARVYLLRYLQAEFSQENVLFWESANEFFDHVKQADMQLAKEKKDVLPSFKEFPELLKKALKLCETFVSHTSPYAVNINSRLNQALIDDLQKKHLISFVEDLIAAQKEILSLMQSDSFRRFQAAPIYQELLRDSHTFMPLTKEQLESMIPPNLKERMVRRLTLEYKRRSLIMSESIEAKVDQMDPDLSTTNAYTDSSGKVWTLHEDTRTKMPYFFCDETGETSWEVPDGISESVVESVQ